MKLTDMFAFLSLVGLSFALTSGAPITGYPTMTSHPVSSATIMVPGYYPPSITILLPNTAPPIGPQLTTTVAPVVIASPSPVASPSVAVAGSSPIVKPSASPSAAPNSAMVNDVAAAVAVNFFAMLLL
jgi:hypothetical protein